MKAVRYYEYGDPRVMRYEDAERPRPTAGQALIQVTATSFNAIDVGIRAGAPRQVFPVRFPHTPGIDEDVTGFSVGDAMIGFLPMNENGAAAEFVV